MRKTPQSPIEASLRRILAAVLAMPLAAEAGCASGSSPPASDAAAAAGDSAVAPAPDAAMEAAGPCAAVEVDGAAYEDAAPAGDGGSCTRFVKLPCGWPASASAASCNPDPATCVTACGSSNLYSCAFAGGACLDGSLVPDADVVLDCVLCPGGAGRRPRGWQPERRAPGGSVLGRHFAGLALLEDASVAAFGDLARSLAAFGAPGSLRRRAGSAAADERRHTAVTGRLARRFGAAPRSARVRATPRPSLEGLILHDAAEGCVGESYGALVAMWQAARASDPEVARAMAGVARDEARHAALSWDVLRWGARHLAPAARHRVLEQVACALERLRAQASERVDPQVVRTAGQPAPEVARELVLRFEALALREARRALGLPGPSGATSV